MSTFKPFQDFCSLPKEEGRWLSQRGEGETLASLPPFVMRILYGHATSFPNKYFVLYTLPINEALGGFFRFRFSKRNFPLGNTFRSPLMQEK